MSNAKPVALAALSALALVAVATPSSAQTDRLLSEQERTARGLDMLRYCAPQISAWGRSKSSAYDGVVYSIISRLSRVHTHDNAASFYAAIDEYLVQRSPDWKAAPGVALCLHGRALALAEGLPLSLPPGVTSQPPSGRAPTIGEQANRPHPAAETPPLASDDGKRLLPPPDGPSEKLRIKALVQMFKYSTRRTNEAILQNDPKERMVHNRANDATACMLVEPAGAGMAWGIEGRYRVVNTCAYAIDANWCANVTECRDGLGISWSIPANAQWPIYFVDPANPFIQVGAGRRENRASGGGGLKIYNPGVDETRQLPQPAPGVTLLSWHRCS